MYSTSIRSSGRTIKEAWPQYWEYARRRSPSYRDVLGSSAKSDAEREENEDGDVASPRTSPTSTSGSGISYAQQLILVYDFAPSHPASNSLDNLNLPGHPIHALDCLLSRTQISLLLRAGYTQVSRPRSETRNPTPRYPSNARLFFRRYARATTENELILEAQIPSVFDAQKMWCYMSMESDGYPRFLRSKALNITLASAVLRSRAATSPCAYLEMVLAPSKSPGSPVPSKAHGKALF